MGLSVGQDSSTISSVKSLIVELENCDTLLWVISIVKRLLLEILLPEAIQFISWLLLLFSEKESSTMTTP